ncbi:uncharacterized protein BKA55DRAFT_569473 [Fusarium redolens]|uniref:Uncharacterized protein n=1 Tax=Fusarium redolens TaxID=48865 RepID=A0A9P9H022_FUSRE|nr:uncharacterized protein BKA55DRAFT_569473 [Fusarium redolens]KAH7248575.1 hypothetical protein BKA55DRAFT_569473 [Fusarium redolens]
MSTNTESTSESSSFNTSTTQVITPTATKLLSLTTPFEQPPGCDSNFVQTSVFPSGHPKSPVPIILSTADSSCYPSGWEDVIRTSRFDFYPAVCPSGWIYYDMQTTTSELSMARCCNKFECTILLY